MRSKILDNIKSQLFTLRISSHLSQNFKKIDPDKIDLLKKYLAQYYFTEANGVPSDYLKTDHGGKDMHDHLWRRQERVRLQIIPWLDSVMTLKNSHILEIGCGTGSATVPLAEQGASVVAIDIEPGSLTVARERCLLHRVNVEFREMNAQELVMSSKKETYDMIIFYASLEHMFLEERRKAIQQAWDRLVPRGFLTIIDSPNRLWYYDDHTSGVSFYHWLPDDLAFYYSSFSPIYNFKDKFRELNDKKIREFLRLGRGISFHDFELALKKRLSNFNVVSSLNAFLKKKMAKAYTIYSLWNKLRGRKTSLNERYTALLMEHMPSIHEGFFQPYLNLIIQKK